MLHQPLFFILRIFYPIFFHPFIPSPSSHRRRKWRNLLNLARRLQMQIRSFEFFFYFPPMFLSLSLSHMFLLKAKSHLNWLATLSYLLKCGSNSSMLNRLKDIFFPVNQCAPWLVRFIGFSVSWFIIAVVKREKKKIRALRGRLFDDGFVVLHRRCPIAAWPERKTHRTSRWGFCLVFSSSFFVPCSFLFFPFFLKKNYLFKIK